MMPAFTFVLVFISVFLSVRTSIQLQSACHGVRRASYFSNSLNSRQMAAKTQHYGSAHAAHRYPFG